MSLMGYSPWVSLLRIYFWIWATGQMDMKDFRVYIHTHIQFQEKKELTIKDAQLWRVGLCRCSWYVIIIDP